MILTLLACGGAPEPPVPTIVDRFECDRCHDAGDRFAAAPDERSCVGCHRGILDGTRWSWALPGRVARWRAHLHRLNDVPDLVALDARVTRRWFVDLVQHPVDLRPGLPATMPRLAIGPDDAEALADTLGLRDDPAQALVGDAQRGLVLIGERCAPCHAAEPLAIDLARVQERSSPQQVARWLDDPAAVVPGARMPDPGLTPAERDDIVAALFAGALAPAPPPAVPPRIRVDRPVSWAEVDEAVFHEVCRHCHATPLRTGDGGWDGGPGNTGGFGFPGAGLDLSSRGGLLARPDLLTPGPDGVAPLEDHLWARHREVAGAPSATLGMPLGLPPLPPDRIALVSAWIAQGAPP